MTCYLQEKILLHTLKFFKPRSIRNHMKWASRDHDPLCIDSTTTHSKAPNDLYPSFTTAASLEPWGFFYFRVPPSVFQEIFSRMAFHFTMVSFFFPYCSSAKNQPFQMTLTMFFHSFSWNSANWTSSRETDWLSSIHQSCLKMNMPLWQWTQKKLSMMFVFNLNINVSKIQNQLIEFIQLLINGMFTMHLEWTQSLFQLQMVYQRFCQRQAFKFSPDPCSNLLLWPLSQHCQED